MATYDGPNMTETLPKLKEGEKEHIIIYHDESAFHANNYKQDYWLHEGEQVLKKKEKGRLIMVLRFINARYGHVALTDELIAANAKLPESERLTKTDSSITIYPSSSASGDDYWNMDQMIEQVFPFFIPFCAMPLTKPLSRPRTQQKLRTGSSRMLSSIGYLTIRPVTGVLPKTRSRQQR